MIAAAYVQIMSRYNAWQNSQLRSALDAMDEAALDLDRGAFFGSIRATLNHLLWGDMLWMSRFDEGCAAPGKPGDWAALWPALPDWVEARTDCDRRIGDWAATLEDGALGGDLTWYSGVTGREVTRPLAVCITHFFNHQTHHRGQVHAMLTAAGADGPVSDLVFMPET